MSRITILLMWVVLASILAGLCWTLARRARADRKRRRRRLDMELRLANALEIADREVIRLKDDRVLRRKASEQNAGLIPSTKVSSLRYIKGRQNED